MISQYFLVSIFYRVVGRLSENLFEIETAIRDSLYIFFNTIFPDGVTVTIQMNTIP